MKPKARAISFGIILFILTLILLGILWTGTYTEFNFAFALMLGFGIGMYFVLFMWELSEIGIVPLFKKRRK